MTETSDFFLKVESLRKHMMLNISQMTELLGVSRMSYYGWVSGKSISKRSEKKVKTTVKKLLKVMQDHNWPTTEVITMEPAERFAELERLLAES